MDKVELESIRATEWAGCEIYYYDCIDSTNTKAKELAESGHPSGTLVVFGSADRRKRAQRQGVGFPSGNRHLHDIDDKAGDQSQQCSMLTLVAAMAVANAISKIAETQALIKWPNDVVINGKKNLRHLNRDECAV